MRRGIGGRHALWRPGQAPPAVAARWQLAVAARAEQPPPVPHPPRHCWDTLHPLHRRFVAYREGRVDGRPHSLEETAEHFGIDLALARLIEQYVAARIRWFVERAGWRAGQAPQS